MFKYSGSFRNSVLDSEPKIQFLLVSLLVRFFLEFQVLGNSWFVRSKPKLYKLQQKVSVFCS